MEIGTMGTLFLKETKNIYFIAHHIYMIWTKTWDTAYGVLYYRLSMHLYCKSLYAKAQKTAGVCKLLLYTQPVMNVRASLVKPFFDLLP